MFFISSDPAGLTESLPQELAGSRARRRAGSQPRQILGATRRLGGTVTVEAEASPSCVWPLLPPSLFLACGCTSLALSLEKVKTLLPLISSAKAEPSMLSRSWGCSGITLNPACLQGSSHCARTGALQPLRQCWPFSRCSSQAQHYPGKQRTAFRPYSPKTGSLPYHYSQHCGVLALTSLFSP